MSRPSLRRLVVALSIVAVGFSASGPVCRAEDAAKALPIYRLEVGQELTYKDDNEMKRGEGPKKGGYSFHTDWKASVVGKNKDGSYRIVIRSAQKMTFDGKAAGRAHTTFGYCDLFPDGRVISNPTLGFSLDPTVLFPRLPANLQEIADGWENVRDQDDTRCAFKVESRPKSASGEWTIAEVKKSPLDEIYLSTHKSMITFDANRGLVTKLAGASTQGWGMKGIGSETLSLVSVEKHDAAWAKKLWRDADLYFQANRAYEDKCELAGKDEKTSKKLLDEAKAILTAAQKDVGLAILKEQLTEALKSHDQTAKYTAEEATRRAKVIGHPAAEFEANDLGGNSHTLKEYRGKVVILDFWYRGCGWCMRAMPQVKQLSAEFRGAPVVVIGMNTDRNDADAKFVVEKMKLDYTTLKIEHQLVEKYGVRGFPTMVIIDQQGKVHDLHVGYTPTLQREVGEIVRQLLARR
jgi:thiol-disulfide isomerase/thioredoxin